MAASRAHRQPSTPSSQTAPAVGFADLGLPTAVVDTLAAAGVTTPFPIQAVTLPDSLSGRDVLGRGRTGSGKTYAFLLPLVSRLSAGTTPRRPLKPRGLVLAPTRELATQIEAALRPLAEATGLRTLTVFGGVGANPQIQGLRRGVDVVIACPGRLEDLVRSGHADLGGVEITVLDEADHMADLGFLPGVRRLMDATPRSGQRMLFSATLDAGVDVLVKRYLSDPVVHSVDTAQSPVTTMAHHVLHVDSRESRLAVITDLAAAPGRTVVFTRTKYGAKAMARQLNARGVPTVELHGNLAQNARTRNLAAFSEGRATTLVATDIAARGIHVDDVSLVVHADPPVEHKAYLHRSGRTARAGAEGTVVTVMLDAQVADVRDLTRKAGIKPRITRAGDGHPVLAEIAPGERSFVSEPAVPADPATSAARPAGGTGSSRRGRNRRGQAQQATSRQTGNTQEKNRQGKNQSGKNQQGQQQAKSTGKAQRGNGQQAAGQTTGRRRSRRGATGGRGPAGAGSGHSAASFSASVRGRGA